MKEEELDFNYIYIKNKRYTLQHILKFEYQYRCYHHSSMHCDISIKVNKRDLLDLDNNNIPTKAMV